MHKVKSSKSSAISYCIMVGPAALLVDYDVIVNRAQDGEFALGHVEIKINEEHEPLVCSLVGQLDHIKRLDFMSKITTLLREDLQQNLYSLYHVGTITD